MGNGSQGEVVIRCEPSAGLAFFSSKDIELRKISLVECGAPQNIPDVSFILYNTIQAAVFFHHCKMTKLTNVHITSSNGTGAIVYNPMGVVNITSCLFSLSGDQLGRGLLIKVNEDTSKSSCIITNSTFTHNNINASNEQAGGGMSVVFSEKAAHNKVQLDGVYIENNKRSGISLAFEDNAKGNIVIINGAVVIENTGSSGGGIFITSESGKFHFGNTIINHKQYKIHLKCSQYWWWHCCRSKVYFFA